MKTQVVIRKATAADADAIGSMVAEFQAYLRGLGDRAEFDFGAAKYLRDGFGDDPAFEGLVAETETGLDGYLLYHFGYDTDAGQRLVHIIDLYVREKSRHRGIGSALMKNVAEMGRAHGARAMFWSVFEANSAALRFYSALGAKPLKDLQFMSVAI
jgi:ribosomal protein S18 acetylase RimI-like enzyme